MSTYPDKKLVAEVLGEVAQTAVIDSTADHPEDLTAAALCAVEGGGLAIEVLWKRGVL